MPIQFTSGNSLSRRELLLSFASALPLAGTQSPTFSADVNVVNLLAAVRDKSGKLVKNLSQEDFILEEDGRPQTIRYFSRETDLPLTLGLLVDTSLSQIRVLGQEKSASRRFFRQVLREDRDHAFVIHFDVDVELLQDVTSSRKRLEAAIEKLETPNPQRFADRQRDRPRRRVGTALYDAVLLAADEVLRDKTGRKAIVLLSDGVDMGSLVSLSSAIEAAQRADTLVYCILFADQGSRGFFGRGRGPDGRETLARMSAETGAGYYEVTRDRTIEKVFALIEDELRNQYNIGYTPDRPAGGGFRKVQLATKQKNLIVRTRDGYYSR